MRQGEVAVWLTGDPKEDDAIVLETTDVELPHFVVSHGSVRQILMNLPRGVRHDDAEFAQHRHVELANVTVDPLRLLKCLHCSKRLCHYMTVYTAGHPLIHWCVNESPTWKKT